MSEDINRDRQPLGIILAAGQSVKYTRPMQYSVQSWPCACWMATVKWSVGSARVEAHIDAASVPFIDTPYVEGMYARGGVWVSGHGENVACLP